VRILVVCPIPVEYTSCRSQFGLRDHEPIAGCRCARGPAAGVDFIAVQAGPAKARAAAATVAAIDSLQPDLVLDTGTCGALDGGQIVGGVVVATECVEYDISGSGLPRRMIAEMKLPSALALLPRSASERLLREATEIGQGLQMQVGRGGQACGEFFIQSGEVRDSLRALTGALAANWETAGVFVAALRSGVPPLSIRSVTDLGDERSLKDFRRNARRSARGLYRYVRSLAEAGWFQAVGDCWREQGPAATRLARSVLP
jgi:adenosylhomocysteine nucleosidase